MRRITDLEPTSEHRQGITRIGVVQDLSSVVELLYKFSRCPNNIIAQDTPDDPGRWLIAAAASTPTWLMSAVLRNPICSTLFHTADYTVEFLRSTRPLCHGA